MPRKEKTEDERLFKMKLPEGYNAAHSSHRGVIIGILILSLVLVLGGLYVWGSLLNEEAERTMVPRNIPNNEPETVRANADVEILEIVSSSDELDAISADLESTNFEGIEADLTAIDQELDAALR